MTTVSEELDDLLPDDLRKGSAAPLVRTPRQQKSLAKKAEADALVAKDAQLAQIVNLHIAGYSLTAIGNAIGASGAEVDRMLATETQRYVRTQPALRTYVRNYVSGKYSALLEGVWDGAVDPTHREQLERQDRALRILNNMARLHGAEAPTQTEVKVEAAPEAVEKLVAALAAGQGLGYDVSIFDVIDGEVVEEAVEQSVGFLETASKAVEDDDEA